jgi:orotidine-5'-phosphate decarboxylase
MSAPVPIVALDYPTQEEARSLVVKLGPAAEFYKVGLQLFTAEGPPVIEWLHGEGKKVFLDLKLHDIPSTVRKAAASAHKMKVALLTVHGLGGEAMIRAAVDGAGLSSVMVVTVLTSMDLATASAALGRPLGSLRDEVLRLSAVAVESGAHGVVCSGTECGAVRDAQGSWLKTLVPGIRTAPLPGDDQSRIVTPAEAASAGAGYIVLGRAVTRADDPAAAFAGITANLG